MSDHPLERSRRGFLSAGATVTSLAAAKAAFAGALEDLPVAAKTWQADKGYWEKIRGKFLLNDGLNYMNNGTVGPTPRPVYENLLSYWRLMAENPNENSGTLQGRLEAIREKAALFIGATPPELAILRNATEGNNLIAQGIDLKAGDEVLMGYLEHDSNRQPWLVKAKRQGIVVKEVPIGTPAKSSAEILNAFDAAITPRSRVIATTHCDTVTGTFVPVKELAALAHSKGLYCFIDGAQVPGMIKVNVKDLGVDSYSTTCHKWLCSPAGTGLLYIRKELQEKIWPNIVSENWWTLTDARKYEHVSRRPWPVVASLEDAIDFQNTIGVARIENRIRALGGYLRTQAAQIPHVKVYTPQDPKLSGAITSLGLDNVAPAKIREYLRQRYDLYVAERTVGIKYPSDPHGVAGIRVSTHFYNTFEQVEMVLEALRDLSSGKA